MERTKAMPAPQTPELGRRAVLAGAAGGLLVALGFRAAKARGRAGPLYVGCRADEAERYFTIGSVRMAKWSSTSRCLAGVTARRFVPPPRIASCSPAVRAPSRW
jgi:hypothetical protein